MNFKKISMMFAAMALSAGLMAGTAMAEDTCQSYLTGETVSTSIGRTRPIAVMFNNIIDAVPQYGIENCGVVYEAPVEGGITRLMGLMEDYQDCWRIGSVRSCRNYYIYFAREWDAIYCHFGQSVYALPILDLESTNNLSGLSDYGETVYYRSDDRVSPHNVFTDYSRIQAGIDVCGYERSFPDTYEGHFKFAADGETVTLDNGQDAVTVVPGYSYNNATFTYDAASGLYSRYQYGDAQIDGNTGNQLTYKNIILQNCAWQNFDDNGYLNIDTVSGGSGTYITNGKAIAITWEKEYQDQDWGTYLTIDSEYCSVPVKQTDFAVTRYYDTDGNEITLNQGKTWICVIQDTYAGDTVISAQ